MEKSCDIRKFITPKELVDIFYSFAIENRMWNRYLDKLRNSRFREIGNELCADYLINEISKTKTTEEYIKTPLYVLSLNDYTEYTYWIDDIMTSWLSYINKYLDSCDFRIKTIQLLIRFLRENNIIRRFKTKLMIEYSSFGDSEYSLIHILKKIETNNAQDEINIMALMTSLTLNEYNFWAHIQKKWEQFYDKYSRTI